MPGSTRDIKRHVRSVKNIRQITRAMELVAAAKMQRAVTSVQQGRRYADLAWNMLRSVTQGVDRSRHPLLRQRPEQSLLVVLMTSHRGLAGGFNAKVCELAHQFVEEAKRANPGVSIRTVAIGRKGRDFLLKMGYELAAEFDLSDRVTRMADILPLASLVKNDYLEGTYDTVAVVYTDFVSLLRQQPRVRVILPIGERDAELGATRESIIDEVAPGDDAYLFEPNPETVLSELVPRLIEVQLYQAVLESNASEQAARMMAMRNASDSAQDLLADLNLTYNQLRQGSITRELAEISAGRMALGA